MSSMPLFDTRDATYSSTTEALTRRSCAILLLVITAIGAFPRLHGLGDRSLWLDEFATWHVSRMELAESLRWPPELTKPPLYQLCLRLLTHDPHPPEWLLRLPAVIAGILVIPAVYGLARSLVGRASGLACAALIACQTLQMDYSREARSYSMLVLGSVLSMMLWVRLVLRPRRLDALCHAIVTALTFHAHYLTGFAVVAQILWWIARPRRHGAALRSLLPWVAMFAAGVLCIPMAWHYLWLQSSIFQGLNWIEPPTLRTTFDILGSLTFGPIWIVAVLLPALFLEGGASFRSVKRSEGVVYTPEGSAPTPRSFRMAWSNAAPPCTGKDMPAPDETGLGHAPPTVLPARGACALLLIWFACSWFGLLLVSWFIQPAMIDRYALPATIPALLFPLVVAQRMHPRGPIVLAGLFILGTAPLWLALDRDVLPGFRELRDELQAMADPRDDVVALVIDNATHAGWEDMERLAFQYYPLTGQSVRELHLDGHGRILDDAILRDPRALYLVVFRADPLPILKAAGRRIAPFVSNEVTYSQLLFSPYRLVRAAPFEEQ